MWKRCVSMLLILCLLAALCPPFFASAGAETEVYRRTLSQGVENIVKRARQMTQIQWTPVADIPAWKNELTYFAGVTYTGLPYGQPVYANYVPWQTSMEGFLDVVSNAGSKMYTDRSSYKANAPYYSIDCSAFVAWAWGLNARQTTDTIRHFSTKISSTSYDKAEVGDCLCLSGYHVVLITDITYDSKGSINGIEISESTNNYSTASCCQTVRYGVGGHATLAEFQEKYFGKGYILYRSKTRETVTYSHSCAVPLPGDDCPLCGVACEHNTFDTQGSCTQCGEPYAWEIHPADAGVYKMLQDRSPSAAGPYDGAAKDLGVILKTGTSVTVRGSLFNAFGEKWYKISYDGGREGYLPGAALSFDSWLSPDIHCNLWNLIPGQTVAKGSRDLHGAVTSSRYPLETVKAYIDGKLYAEWSAENKNTYGVGLQYTDINNKLSFRSLSTGNHTLTITAKDLMHKDAVQILSLSFRVGTTSTALHTVTFCPNGGSCATTAVAVAEGKSVADLPIPERTGYRFDGWYTAADGGTRLLADTTVTKNISVFAHWTPISGTVSFFADGDLCHTATVDYAGILSEFPKLSREGYTYSGWFTDPEANNAFLSSTAILSDIRLYCFSSPNRYQVTLDPNGGSLEVSSVEVVFDDLYGQLPVPQQGDRIFLGWYMTEKDAWYRVEEDHRVTIPRDHVLTAQWADIAWDTGDGILYLDGASGAVVAYEGSATELIIPETVRNLTVTGIAENAFRGNTALKIIEIPNTVVSIGQQAFFRCSALEEIRVSQDHPEFSAENGILMNIDGTQLHYCPANAVESTYTVPETVTSIAPYAFYDCRGLAEVHLGSHVAQIGMCAFSAATVNASPENDAYRTEDGVLLLKDENVIVHFPQNRTGSFTVPQGITAIGAGAFYQCGLTEITLPESLRQIGDFAFAHSDELENIYFEGDAPELGEKCFTVDTVLCYCEWSGGWTSPMHAGYNSRIYAWLVPDAITSGVYAIGQGYIRKIRIGTTVEALLSGIGEQAYTRVFETLQEVSGKQTIGTGMQLKLMDGTTVKDTLTAVVTGDISGDGKITITDLLSLKAALLKKKSLTGAFAQAADTNGDGKITITDFLQIKANLLKKGTITPN